MSFASDLFKAGYRRLGAGLWVCWLFIEAVAIAGSSMIVAGITAYFLTGLIILALMLACFGIVLGFLRLLGEDIRHEL